MGAWTEAEAEVGVRAGPPEALHLTPGFLVSHSICEVGGETGIPVKS